MDKFEKLMNTEFTKKLSKESNVVIRNTFEDFVPEYSEWILEVIEDIYGYDCYDDLEKVMEIEERLKKAILLQKRRAKCGSLLI